MLDSSNSEFTLKVLEDHFQRLRPFAFIWHFQPVLSTAAFPLSCNRPCHLIIELPAVAQKLFSALATCVLPRTTEATQIELRLLTGCEKFQNV